MTNYAYWATKLTGGSAGTLDNIDGGSLADKDMALTVSSTGSEVYFFWLDEDNAGAESSPTIIAPDSNGGNKRWVLIGSLNQDLSTDADVTFNDITVSTPSNIYALSHDSFADFAANEHYLQTTITNVSTALSTGLLKVTTGTGALSSITDSSSNWDAAYTHVSNNGTDHSYIDQDLQTTATPTFDDLTITTPVNIYGLSHDSFTDFTADEHFLQTAITNVSTALSTGMLKVTTGTGELSSVTTFFGLPGVPADPDADQYLMWDDDPGELVWSAPAGAGDVTAAANLDDNTIIRGDGGVKGIQDTGIVIDDSDNLTMLVNTTLTIGDGGETITSDNTDLTITSGVDINLTATSDVNIPANIGMTFGDDGEKIEGDGTDLTIASSAKLNLTATSDVIVPVNVGIILGDGAEKLESDNTDLTINSGGKINLTATSDVIVPVNVGVIFGDGAEKIESDNTDFTLNSGGDINLIATADINVPANIGMTFGDDGEKIEGDGTDLTITSSGKLNLNSTGTIEASYQGIADNAVLTVDDADAADNDYAKFTANGLEGRSYDEVMSDLSAQATAAFGFNNQIVQAIKGITLTDFSELTIDADGAVTVTQMCHNIDTENDDATDNLVTINGGGTVDMIVIRPNHDDRTVVVKHNTGNIWLQGGSDVTLDDVSDSLLLVYDNDNSVWVDIAAGGGAAAGNHAILDGSVHTDSVADAVTRGSIIYGNSTPKWDELVVGAADTFLGSDGTDLSYRTATQVKTSLGLSTTDSPQFANIGIGVAASSTYSLFIYESALETTTSYGGIFSSIVKTAGVTDENDELIGITASALMNDADSTIGSITGLLAGANVTSGTIGAGTADVIGANIQNVIAGGTLNHDLYGTKISLDIDVAVTSIAGNVYGIYIDIDADKDPSGSVYMLYLNEQNNVDYGIYQNGTANNRFGGNVGINVVPSSALLHIDQSAATGNTCIKIDQADDDQSFMTLIGTATNNDETKHLVDGGDEGAQTLAGWYQIYVQDDGDIITDGNYWVPFYTITT